MKYLIIIILSFCSFEVLSQQVELKVNGQETNLLYRIYYNKVSLTIDSIPFNNINIAGDNVLIERDSHFFYVRIKDKSHKVVLTIYDGIRSVKTISFQVLDDIPMPDIHVNGIKRIGQGISLSTKSDSIYSSSYFKDRYNLSIPFRIVRFNVGVIIKKKAVFSELTRGSKLSIKVKEYLPNMKLGDGLIMEDIVLKDDFGNSYVVSKKEFKVLP